MSSRLPSRVFRSLTPAIAILLLAVLAGGCAQGSAEDNRRVLKVCSDPNNLPFSNEAREGFEHQLAELVARDRRARVEYTWWAQRRGFIRNTLRAGSCDVLMGMPSSMELALATRPYYRSTYVFVTRADADFAPESLDDPLLHEVSVGVQVIGDDYSNAPPAHALARRGIVENVRGYSVYGDYTKPNPPASIVRAVAEGEVDVAIVWGPLAGYFAERQSHPLRLAAVSPEIDLPFLPMVFDISMGVRREDALLRDELDAVLVRRAGTIDSMLDRYGIPRLVHGRLHDPAASPPSNMRASR